MAEKEPKFNPEAQAKRPHPPKELLVVIEGDGGLKFVKERPAPGKRQVHLGLYRLIQLDLVEALDTPKAPERPEAKKPPADK